MKTDQLAALGLSEDEEERRFVQYQDDLDARLDAQHGYCREFCCKSHADLAFQRGEWPEVPWLG